MSVEEGHLRSILNGFTGAEMEYLAEESLVTVDPAFSQEAIPLLGTLTPVGPFQPAVHVDVPLWMAIALKKMKRVTIVPPEWMRLERLTAWRDEEKRLMGDFVPPPIDPFIEHARILMAYAKEDVERYFDTPAKDIMERLGDICDLRQAKVQAGLVQITAQTPYLRLNNMSRMELNTIRTFYSTTLSKFQRLQLPTEEEQTQSQLADQSQAAAAANQAQAAPSQDYQLVAQRARGRQQQPPATPSQPGALTQAADAGLEQARKLRRFQ